MTTKYRITQKKNEFIVEYYKVGRFFSKWKTVERFSGMEWCPASFYNLEDAILKIKELHEYEQLPKSKTVKQYIVQGERLIEVDR